MAEKEKKAASRKRVAAVAGIVAAVIGLSSYWYTNYQVPHQNAVAAYDKAVANLNSRNSKLDETISNLQNLMGAGDEPLDAGTLDAASAAIGKAQAARQDAPEMPSDTDEIVQTASEIDGMGDYSAQLAELDGAQVNLQNSIDQLKLVTNLTEQFVIERLTGLPNITGVEAVTEQNDPNGKLGKQGGYSATVYFSSDLVDSSETYADEAYTGIPAVGADGGGAVEVYANVDDAQERDAYLGAFDGGLLSSGSHVVVGTCVVRTSDLLTASQQQTMQDAIIASLTRLG